MLPYKKGHSATASAPTADDVDNLNTTPWKIYFIQGRKGFESPRIINKPASYFDNRHRVARAKQRRYQLRRHPLGPLSPYWRGEREQSDFAASLEKIGAIELYEPESSPPVRVQVRAPA